MDLEHVVLSEGKGEMAFHEEDPELNQGDPTLDLALMKDMILEYFDKYMYQCIYIYICVCVIYLDIT